MDLGQLFAFSTFSEYGSDIPKEIMAEVFLSILTIQGSLFYNRAYGTSAKRAESRPLNLSTELRLQNEIINSLQDYNENVDDSTERRVAIPADSIKFQRGGPGELDVKFGYYQLRDLKYNEVSV
jgi:hypothetical protein